MNPLISILVPVYNVEAYLHQCVDSILSQTYKNLQIVLVDDGSTDGSWTVCKTCAEKDSRVEVYHKDNSGVADTRNYLLEKVKGDYVLFVDSDDWIESDMGENLLNYALKYNADVVNCDIVINDIKCDKECSEIELMNQETAVCQFLRHQKFRGSLCNKFIKVNLIQDLRFRNGVSLGEDALFCWEVLQKASKVTLINKQYYHYRMVETSLTHASFGPKKLSAYTVWDSIMKDVERYWPNFLDIVRARFCIEMTLLLRDAIHSGYSYDDEIRKLQNILRKFAYSIRTTKLSSRKMYLYALVGARNYKCLRFLP